MQNNFVAEMEPALGPTSFGLSSAGPYRFSRCRTNDRNRIGKTKTACITYWNWFPDVQNKNAKLHDPQASSAPASNRWSMTAGIAFAGDVLFGGCSTGGGCNMAAKAYDVLMCKEANERTASVQCIEDWWYGLCTVRWGGIATTCEVDGTYLSRMRRIGSTPDKGVPDMTCISDIDENGINRNLKVRYERDQIYVSFYNHSSVMRRWIRSVV
uniref:Uncharacterized protein n=1 Tax=Anopheles culicifacies TaxID=139723 RepID=A0A182MTQ7_9DIPT